MTERPTPTQFDLDYGQRVKEARRAADLTQTELAHLVGLTRSSIANLEAGRQSSFVGHSVVLAEMLNVSIQWLLTGDDTCEVPVPTEPPIPRSRLREIRATLCAAVAALDAVLPGGEPAPEPDFTVTMYPATTLSVCAGPPISTYLG